MRHAALLFMLTPLLWACGGSGSGDRGPAGSAGATDRPNVILVLADDQGYGDLSVTGNDVIRTPNIDRLAAESVRLTDFHVDPTCSPTRAALLTGRYSTRTGIWHTITDRSLMAPDEETLAEVFAGAGYRTGMVGKWHLGDNYPLRPQDQGFEEAFYFRGGVVGQVADHFANDLYDDTYFRNGRPEQVSGYATDVWFNEAVSFVERNRNRPFFLYVAPNAAHWPYVVDDKYIRPYLDAGVPRTMARFYGMITVVDENLGRLRARLAELGLAENTIFIFMTDNGSAEGWSDWRKEPGSWKGFNAGMRGGKGSEYDGGHRVPFYIYWPSGGLTGGIDVQTLTAHIDVLPTLAELCGIELPATPPLDGTSLAPLLRRAAGGSAVDGAFSGRVLFVHSQRVETPIKWRQATVMTERWRLIDGKELYDIAADPGQQTDVAGDHPEVVERLRSKYDAWWASLEPVFDRTVRIKIGSDAENPTLLTAHDWRADHDSEVVWNTRQVFSLAPINGSWLIDVVRAGTYEIELRRWQRPSYLGLDALHARLEVGGITREAGTSPYDPGAVFRVELKPGPTTLRTWLSNRNGPSRGAYFVYVRRLDEP